MYTHFDVFGCISFITIRAIESILSGDTTVSGILPLVNSPVSTVATISVGTEQRFITVFARHIM